ncbi:glycosyltransferase family 4 protein [Phocaeicola sp.]
MNYLAEQPGYEVYVVTDSQAGRPLVFPLSPKVKHIDLEIDFGKQYHYNILVRFFYYAILMAKYKKRLTALLYKLKPDIVITTCGRDMDFITDISDGSLKLGEIHIAKAFCRNFHLLERRGFPYKQVAKYWMHKQEEAIKQLDAFVVLTQNDAESWNSIRKVEVIPNPYSFAPKHPSNCKAKRIISAGRLNEQKGYERLIEAWSYIAPQHPEWKIDLYGHGEEKEKFDKMIKDLKIEKSFHILPPTNHIMDEFCKSSFYVMSSRFEGLPMVLLEAMSCGLPCISFDCPHGPSDLIRNGVNGILVENGNIRELACAIEKMISDEDRRIEMGQKAFQLVQKYSPDNIMPKWIHLFNSLKRT